MGHEPLRKRHPVSGEVRRALLNPGPSPATHAKACARLRREWPTLWKALMRSLRSGDRALVQAMADNGEGL